MEPDFDGNANEEEDDEDDANYAEDDQEASEPQLGITSEMSNFKECDDANNAYDNGTH